MSKYDCIIIGAGLGGLTAGAILSKNGKKVLVIEMHNKVGGFATDFIRRDYKFDVSLHNFGPLKENIVVNKAFSELGVYDKIEYIQYDYFQRVIFPEHDLIIERPIEKYIDTLVTLFKEEEKGIRDLFNIMIEIKREFDEIEGLDVTIDKLEEVYPMLPIKFPLLVKYVETTFGELLGNYIKNDKLKGIIGNLWWIYGVPPDRLAAILYSVPTVAYYNYSGGFIKGTSQTLSDTLATIIKENNGEIRLNCDVRKIIMDGNRAVGIKTQECKDFYGDIIISNSNAYETFIDFMDENDYNKRFRKKISKLELSLSANQLYLGLNCDARDIGINDHCITVFDSYDMNENFNWIINGEYDKTFYSLTNYSLFDKSLTKDGKCVISVMSLDHIKNWEGLTREEYRNKKEMVSNIIIEKLKKRFLDIDKYIEVQEFATPLTMKRYTRNPDGAIYGSSQINSQSGVNRLSYKTPFESLYLVGAYVYPGAGYSSVISSGYKTAKEILKLFNKG